MTDLKPCPFCGGTNIELRDNGIGDSYAICYSDDPSEVACGARTDDANCETDESANSRWNKRASPPGGEWQGIDTASQSQPCADGESAARTMSEPSGEEFLEFKEALDDLRSLRAEHRDLNGGGPGWSARWEAAWAKANDLFANEDEAAWCRQQEDAHG